MLHAMKAKRDALIKVRVSAEERARLADFTQQAGMPLSTWMRAIALVASHDVSSLRTQLLRERIITSLLAQYALGSGGDTDGEWEQLHEDMWEAVKELAQADTQTPQEQL